MKLEIGPFSLIVLWQYKKDEKELVELLRSGQYIGAIKRAREFDTSLSLKDAVTYVQRLKEENGIA